MTSLGEFEMLLLGALLMSGEDMSVPELMTSLHTFGMKREIQTGALYTTLARMYKKGYVRTTYIDSKPTGYKGRSQSRFYHVTANGEQALLTSLEPLGRIIGVLSRRQVHSG